MVGLSICGCRSTAGCLSSKQETRVRFSSPAPLLPNRGIFGSMRVCSKCGLERKADDFHKHRGKPASVCKLCRVKIHRAHYLENKAQYIKQARERKAELYRLYNETRNHPCIDCGHSFPVECMDLDHRPRTIKVDSVSRMLVRGLSRDAILKEIAKCDVVCANCHRIRTAKRARANGARRHLVGLVEI